MHLFRTLRWVWPLITIALLGYGLHVALTVPPDADQGNVGRIFYYHVPTWVATSVCFLTNLICSVIYLVARTRSAKLAMRMDALAVSSAEMGVVFCFLGMATGSLWGRAVWGIWWTWDARLTSTLVLWLIYISYLMLRHFVSGDAMRTLAAVVAIFAYCDVPLVYMATRWWRTQHPAPVFFGGPDAGVAPNPDACRAVEHCRLACVGRPGCGHPLCCGTPSPVERPRGRHSNSRSRCLGKY